MDPHLLRTFVAVTRHGSFSAAAEELGYTQSAVSQQIAALESDLGVPLLHRRPVSPTHAGERLLEHARPLLLRLDAARADVIRAAAPIREPIRLAATSLALTPAVAALLGEARVATADSDGVTRLVATGEADLGLVDGIAAPSDPLHLPDVAPLTTVRVTEDDLAVVVPDSHPLAGRRGLDLGDLVDARWIDAPSVTALDRLRVIARTDGFRLGSTYTGGDVRSLLILVAAGHGLALLPHGVVVFPGVTGVPLSAPRLIHRVELVHGALPDGAARRFADALGETH